MPENTQRILFHSAELELLPERAIWWPETRTLILSDVHLGKSATFRAHGLPVPEGETSRDLQRITDLVASRRPESLVIVGDLFHSSLALRPETLAEFHRFFADLPTPSILVRGNHDPSERKLEAIPSLKTNDRHRIGPIHFVHDPAQLGRSDPAIVGHLHPLCLIGKRGGPTRRVPCFYRDAGYLALPAFGTFTSGNPVTGAGRCYPIAGNRVYPPVPPASRPGRHATRKPGNP